MHPTKIIMLGAMAFAVLSTGTTAFSGSADAGKEQPQRTKPHVNAKPGPNSTNPHDQHVPNTGPHDTGIEKPHPDLVFKQPYGLGSPPGAPMSGYCGSNQGAGGPARTVVIPVRNNGDAPAKSFKVKVTFKNANPAEKVIQTTYAGQPAGSQPTIKAFHIPSSAWKNRKASFKVEIDPNNSVKEGIFNGEKNNRLNSFCSAPAG